MRNTNMKKMTILKIRGNDYNKEFTSLLMLGTVLMLLKGLKTLRVLKDFKFGVYGIIEIQLRININMSNTFHGSLR